MRLDMMQNNITGFMLLTEILDNHTREPVTYLAFSWESILHKPAHSPKVFALGTMKRLTLCSTQMALTGLT